MEGYGERIKRVRELLGLSQQDLAAILGVHKQMVSDVERGKQKRFSMESEARLLEKLGVDSLWLLVGKGEPLRPQKDELQEELAIIEKYFRKLPANSRISAIVEILKILDPFRNNSIDGKRYD